jgi:hypothetical protein
MQQLSTVPLPQGNCPETGQASGTLVATIVGGPKHPNHPPGVVLGGKTDVIDIIPYNKSTQEEIKTCKGLDEETLMRK